MTLDRDAVELLPCPFCGNVAKLFFDPDRGHVVGCVQCRAYVCRDRSEGAIAAWNRRAPLSSREATEGGEAVAWLVQQKLRDGTPVLRLPLLPSREDMERYQKANPDVVLVPLYTHPSPSKPEGEPTAQVDDPDDPKWNAGVNYAIERLCEIFGIDPRSISWDAATETVDGDVSSVLCNVLRAAYGEEWSSQERDTAAIRAALRSTSIPPSGVAEARAEALEEAANVAEEQETEFFTDRMGRDLAGVRKAHAKEIATAIRSLIPSKEAE